METTDDFGLWTVTLRSGETLRVFATGRDREGDDSIFYVLARLTENELEDVDLQARPAPDESDESIRRLTVASLPTSAIESIWADL